MIPLSLEQTNKQKTAHDSNAEDISVLLKAEIYILSLNTRFQGSKWPHHAVVHAALEIVH